MEILDSNRIPAIKINNVTAGLVLIQINLIPDCKVIQDYEDENLSLKVLAVSSLGFRITFVSIHDHLGISSRTIGLLQAGFKDNLEGFIDPVGRTLNILTLEPETFDASNIFKEKGLVDTLSLLLAIDLESSRYLTFY